MFEHITANELAGYGVGALLLCATISAPRIDALISASQRSSLGMCKRCGDLRMIACSKCKGAGFLKQGGPLDFVAVGDLAQTYRARSNIKSSGCTGCKAKGRFNCPDCSNLAQN
ncbi:uncharacterized protein LOC127803250 [Diospyros lotus]|uniref:uncharacterized protein LOC127803250 n=1 Tax=Diospyros lotus TaxID=55363 RepID=UPI00224EF595|nr:uncharacterized protein LOC127803250 [Diospyros lotus]